jgi:hypothetical protein
LSEELPVTDGRDPLPARTTPTWEMELLVSGGTAFGLLQLPSLLDRAFFLAMNAASVEIAELVKLLYIYTKIALVTLLLTFILHLCLRGYWVALVGMDSVYPGGVRWGKLRLGPVARRASEAGARPMPVEIEVADNRATRVFGLGFALAMLMLVPAALMLVGIGMAMFARPLPGGLGPQFAIAAALLLLLGPWVLASALDGKGDRGRDPASRLGRAMSSVFRFYGRIGLDGRGNLPLALFMTHEGLWRTARAGLVVMLVVVAVIVAPVLSVNDSRWFSDRTLPEATMAQALPEFYADAGVSRHVAVPHPWIATRIVRDDYLAVFIPYLPRRHVPAMRKACPDVSAGAATGTPVAGARTCLARVIDLRVDGVPADVAFEESADPQTGQRGFLAMVPVRGLAPGRHELSLKGPMRGAGPKGGLQAIRIPFWR